MHKIYYDKEKTLPVTDYEVCRHAIPIIRTGIWYVYGETRVWARDDASVWAYENSLVNAHENSKVYSYGNSWVCRGVEWPMTIFQNSKIIDMRNKDEKRK